MANRAQSYPENQPGPWFVDQRCIDCDVCRQLAGATFAAADDHSFVKQQPAAGDSQRDALRALLACPTGAIGSADLDGLGEVRESLPEVIAENVCYNGFTSEKSFGSHSYFIRHEAGNWLADSPRFLEPLARKFEALGGIDYIFLSHRDDMADAAKYAQRFSAQRVIHRLERSAQPEAEIVIDGQDPVPFGDDFLVIPTPGHTAGHCVVQHGTFLFTGDHLWWDRDQQQLDASRDYCWWSWEEQIRSLEKLLLRDFEWVLPGHGERIHLPRDTMRAKLQQLLESVR